MVDSIRSTLLLSPVEEEMRVVLRRLFSRLLAMECDRYNPLYVGPVRRADPVRRALEEAAKTVGATLLSADQITSGDAPAGVALVPLAASSLILSEDKPGRRWVVVGTTDPDEVPPPFLDRLRTSGLIYDTRQMPAPASAAPDLAAELFRRVKVGGHSLLAVVADANESTAIAAETALRLRIFGCPDGRVWDPGPELDAARLTPPAPGGALVIKLDAVPRRDTVAAVIERVRRMDASVVFVAPGPIARALAEDPATAGMAVVRASHLPVPESVRQAPWPPVGSVLTGAPRVGASRELIFQLDGGERDLWHVIKSAAAYSRTGYLLIYSPACFGWIRVDGFEGEITAAWTLGQASPETADAAEMMARMRGIALWEDVRVLFVAASDPEPIRPGAVGVGVDTVIMDIMRTLDESRAGLLSADAALHSNVTAKPSAVAQQLLWWGQPRFGYEVLEAAERASPWGAEEDLLLGYLSAERDPREAAARLQHAAHRLSSTEAGQTQQMDATLSALLLEVRARPSYAFAAWAVVARWLESHGEEFVQTSRHAALLYELAARAGQLPHAIRFRARLFELAAPGDPLPGWVQSSDPLPALEAAG